MTENRVKRYVATLLITLNTLIIFLAFVCFVAGGFDVDQFITLIAIIAPMFACYLVPAVRYIMKYRYIREDSSDVINTEFALFSFGAPFVIAVAVMVIILLQAGGNVFTDFQEFKKFLFGLVTGFSFYIGNTIYSMYSYTEPTISSSTLSE